MYRLVGAFVHLPCLDQRLKAYLGYTRSSGKDDMSRINNESCTALKLNPFTSPTTNKLKDWP